MTVGSLWASLSAGFREDTYMYIGRVDGSGEVDMAVIRDRLEIGNRIHRFGAGRPFSS